MTDHNAPTREKCPMCEANMKVLEACEKYVPGVTRFFKPCPSCSAPPPSSVPGEAGPYYFWLTEKFGGAHLMGPGIADFPVEVWYTPDNLVALGNKAHAQGRASMKAELEAAREGLRNAKVAMTCAGNSREPYDIGRYLRDGLVAVDAALTPSKENQS